MAVIAKVDTPAKTWGDSAQYVSWPNMLQSSTDVGEKFECPGASDRSVQLQGTLGTGGVITMQGSNVASPADAAASTDWGSVHDMDGNVLTLDAIGQIKQIQEVTRWLRPRVTAGDGVTDLSVYAVARRG